MKIFVTGGAGYIGSHVVWALSEAGHDVWVYDDLSSGHKDAVDRRVNRFIQADINNAEALRGELRNVDPDAVVHLAGKISVAESVARPDLHWITNVAGTLTLLEAIRALDNPVPLVYSSSAAVYGNDPIREVRRGQIPFSEYEALRPSSPYGFTKLTAEHAIRDYSTAYALPWIALRYFNAAGANVPANLRERHDPETHLVPTLLDVAAGIRSALPLHGVNYSTYDGTAIRDYVHVMDVADAHVRAVEKLVAQDREASGAFNLGTGRGHSVFEVLKTVEDVTKKPVPFEELAQRAGDPPYLVADPDKATVFLDWKAKRTLRQIVEDAWALHPKESNDDLRD